MVEEPDPGAPIEDGLKLAVAPEGRPEALSEIEALKPPEIDVLIVLVPEEPWLIVSDEGDAEIVKLGEAPVLTVSETLVVCVTPPPAPVTVMG
jgi:hypothetical protein